jgi:tetratricopeptide (TPR) repeat protein
VRKDFTCGQGHRWEVSLDGDFPVVVAGIVCPVCGASAQTFTGQESAFDEDTEVPTAVPATPEAPAAPTEPEASPPGYEILGELGRGGMGVVYKARQVGLKRVVALKMILAPASAGLEPRARFRLEAEAAARLQHPHIAQIYEIGEHAGRPFFSMEFAPGGSLEKRLAGAPQPANQGAELIETLARAIHHAHEQGIVHRDLKPANVLLQPTATKNTKTHKNDEETRPDSSDPFFCDFSCFSWPFLPKITDFGLAKQLGEEVEQTRSGAILATPSYMAPEQATGRKDGVGPWSDVYALGAILYELLTGRPPFRGTTVLETLEQVRSQEPLPPRRLNPAVPRDLDTVALKCLEKDPRRRYARAGALADDLGRFLRGEPIQARPVGAVGRLARWCRRKPALAGVTAALVLVVAGALVTVTCLWLLAEQHRCQAERNAQNEEKQRQQAERNAQNEEKQRKRAEENLQAAQKALEDNLRVAFAFLQRKEPGTVELRKQLLQSALKSVAALHAQHRQDRRMRIQVAAHYFYLANISRELGSPEEALAGYHKARELFEGLLAEDLSDKGRGVLQRALAECFKHLGGVESARGRHVEALEPVGRAAKLLEELARHHPNRPEIASDLGETYANLGILHARRGQTGPALQRFEQALAIQEKLAHNHPNVADYQHRLANTHFNRGLTQAKTGRADEALGSLERALAIRNTLVRDHAAHLGYRSDRGNAWAAVGATQELRGCRPEAVRAYERVIADQRVAFDKERRVPEYRQRLSAHYRSLAALQRVLGRPAEAAAASEERQKLWPKNPAQLFEVAREFALCAALVPEGQAEANTERAKYVEHAVAALREASRHGFTAADRLHDRAFAPLRQHPEYDKLLKELSAKVKTGAR